MPVSIRLSLKSKRVSVSGRNLLINYTGYRMGKFFLCIVLILYGLPAAFPVFAQEYSYCSGETAMLESKGANVRWYADSHKSKLLHTGNTYQMTVTKPDTFYVTQTLQNQETKPVPVVLKIGDPVISHIAVTHASCNKDNGAISVTAQGDGLTYSLNNGPFQTSPVFSSLYSKFFKLTVKSTQGCMVTREVEIERKSVPSFVMAVVLNPCEPGNKDFGALALGGYGEITYALDDGPFQQSGIFQDLEAGRYMLRAKDSQSCESKMEIVIPDQNQAVTLDDVKVEHARCGGEFGVVAMHATGNGPLQYSLDGTTYAASPDFYNVSPGAYTVFVKDGAGCTDSAAINIKKSPAPVILDVIESNASCGKDDGSLIIHAIGSGPLFFSIDAVHYVTDTVFTSLSPLVQNIYIRDTAGCDMARSVTIGRDCLDNVYIPTAFSPDQDGINEVMEIKFSMASVKITSFRVFNRWGNVITSVTNKAVQSGVALWDGFYKGDKVPPGAYPYELGIEFENGRKELIRNTIMVMR